MQRSGSPVVAPNHAVVDGDGYATVGQLLRGHDIGNGGGIGYLDGPAVDSNGHNTIKFIKSILR